jgi:antitoxin MazE
MQTCVQKWGNSYGIRIPLPIMRQLHLYQGSLVDLRIEADCLIIDIPKYNLNEMISKITDDNMHHLLLEDASSEGTEAW